MCVLPCCRTGAVPEQRGVSLLPQAPRCRIPFPPHTSKRRRATAIFHIGCFFVPLPRTGRIWSSSQRKRGYMDAKRGCEKSLLCLMAQATNFSHPRQVLVFFLTAARRRFRPPAQHHAIKRKTASRHTAAPAKTYKPWDRPASRSLRHNVCNASIPSVTGPRPAPRDFSGARTKNQLQFL